MDEDGRCENGYVLVVLAFCLVLLLGFAAIAVDLGVMYGAHTAAQRAADAAALSGAFTFTLANPSATDPELQTNATVAAQNAATQNSILGATITTPEVTVSFPNGVANRLIQVDIAHSIGTFFAGVLGWKTAGIRATAFAEASTTVTGADCVKPWFIPNTLLANQIAPSLDPCSTCPNPVGDGTLANLVSYNDQVGSAVQNYIYTQSAPFRVKPGNPENSLAPGDFFCVRLGNGTGGDVYRENISTCGDFASVRCGDMYSIEPGNMIGPTQQGAEVLLGPTPDTWYGFVNQLPTYNSATGPHVSHQTVLAPVWDTCSTICTSGMKLSGSTVQIKVIGFAVLFISGTQGNDVMAYLVDSQPCSGDTPGQQTGPMAIPLRLVRIN